MAQQDTGMNWNAKDNWLTDLGGIVIAQINGGLAFDGITDQPIPRCSSDQETVENGYFLYRLQSNNHEIYVSANNDYDILVWRDGRTQYMISTSYDAEMRVVEYYNGSFYNTSIVNPNNTEGDYYYNSFAYIATGFYPGPTVPNWTLSTAISKITSSVTPIAKLNPGYAVVCVAQWYTPEGNELISPVLISTNPDFTILSYDGTTPASGQTTFDFLYDGLRFYMTLLGGNTEPISTTFPYADLRQFAASMPSKIFSLLASESFANIIVAESPDPYTNETDPSAEEGGDGENPDDDPVEEETLPLPSVSGLGFCTIYVPSDTDLLRLAQYLWGGNLDLDNFLKLFANPMDSILGLSAVPVSLPGTSSPVYMGGQLLENITLPRFTGRTFVKVDMGTMTIDERWGSYLDYDPYTELSLYLPFIGIKNIKADDVMKKTISLTYSIDILSGACVAYIRPVGKSVLYEWSGQCAMQIPITGQNWDNVFATATATAVSLGAALFSPSPVSAGAIASTAVQAISAKPRVERSGAVSGLSGFLGQLRPYLIRVIPDAYIPNEQNKYIGYPSFITVNLGNLTGYNEVSSIHLEGIPATGNELSEIETLLKGGVIF